MAWPPRAQQRRNAGEIDHRSSRAHHATSGGAALKSP
jgi:hypothetical protein